MPVYRNPDFRRLPHGLGNVFAARAQDGFFAQPAWYELMARHATGRDAEIRVYADERPGSQVALVLQVARPQRQLASLTNYYSIEHAIIAARGADLARGLGAIVAELGAELPLWERLTLSELDPRDAGWNAAVTALRHAGFLVDRGFLAGIWYEDTAGLDFSDYVAQRPSELRHTWQRKRRKAATFGKAFFTGSSGGIDQAIADYQAVYAASWKPPEPFPEFIPALIRLAAAEGTLRLGVYYVEGAPAAAQLWIVADGRAAIYKLAHDRRFDDMSLGTLLTMEMIERALTEDRPYEINFGRGDDPYKKMWLPKRRERWAITAANPRTWRGLGFGLRREAAKIYHRLRGDPLAPKV